MINIDLYSTLGTPTEEAWPGVSSLPDYKCNFPSWKNNILHTVIPMNKFDDNALDLLKVFWASGTCSILNCNLCTNYSPGNAHL